MTSGWKSVKVRVVCLGSTTIGCPRNGLSPLRQSQIVPRILDMVARCSSLSALSGSSSLESLAFSLVQSQEVLESALFKLGKIPVRHRNITIVAAGHRGRSMLLVEYCGLQLHLVSDTYNWASWVPRQWNDCIWFGDSGCFTHGSHFQLAMSIKLLSPELLTVITTHMCVC